MSTTTTHLYRIEYRVSADQPWTTHTRGFDTSAEAMKYASELASSLAGYAFRVYLEITNITRTDYTDV